MPDTSWLLTQPVDRRAVLRLGAASLLAGAGIGCSLAGSSTASPSSATPSFTPLQKLIDQRAAQNMFSGTVLIARGGQTLFSTAAGHASEQGGEPNTLNTIYALGSTAKTFTAVSIARLAQQGKLSFQDKLGQHLDGFPSAIADGVTINELLTHTSGMGDVLMDPRLRPLMPTWTTPEAVLNGVLDLIRTEPLQSPPGSKFSYSNSGYMTLGGVVERVSGTSFYDYVRQNVFAPAGMRSTDFYTRPQRESNPMIARPYHAASPGGPLQDMSNQGFFIGTPAGDAYSTVEDMLRYSQALQGNRLLDAAQTQVVMTGKVTSASGGGLPWHQSDHYAYGLSDGRVNGQRVVWHNGGAPGVGSWFDMFPTAGWTIVVLTNRDAMTIEPLVREAENVVTGKG